MGRLGALSFIGRESQLSLQKLDEKLEFSSGPSLGTERDSFGQLRLWRKDVQRGKSRTAAES